MSETRRYLPPIVAIFLLLVGTVTGIILVQQPVRLQGKAALATSLSVYPSKLTKVRGEIFTFSILLNVSDQNVNGIDLVLRFDPSLLTIKSLTPGRDSGDLDMVIEKAADNANGYVTYRLTGRNKLKAITGRTIDVVDVTVKVKDSAKLGTSTISFGPSTSISTINDGPGFIPNTSGVVLDIISTGN